MRTTSRSGSAVQLLCRLGLYVLIGLGLSQNAAFATCTVHIDKQVSCDGGVTFVDQGFSDGVTQTCSAALNDPNKIVVRYIIRNDPTSMTSVFSCNITESNSQISASPIVVPVPSNMLTPGSMLTVTLPPKTCTSTLAAGEPDTATAHCTCGSDGSILPTNGPDSDTAGFTCSGGGGGGGGSGCFLETPGFWKTHPTATQTFLPLINCGLTINNTTAHVNSSAVEDMCYGNDFTTDKQNTSPQQLQLIRSCMGANLNVAASRAAGGNCNNTAGTAGIDALIASCCNTLCPNKPTAADIDASNCINALDAFNNSTSTITSPVASMAADSTQCSLASGNNFVNHPALTGDARVYGPH